MQKNQFELQIIIKKIIISNTLINILGISFIMLSILYLNGYIEITSQFVLGIALSGLFFVLSDFLFNLQENYLLQKIKHHNRWIEKTYDILRLFSLYISIFSLIAVPLVKLPFEPETIDKYATVASIAAIGLTILNIGYSNSKAEDEYHKHIFQAFKTSSNYYGKHSENSEIHSEKSISESENAIK